MSEETMNFGMKVIIVFKEGTGTILRNVTEVHYRYPGLDKKRIAFESDAHGTGVTYSVDDIEEFEVFQETEEAEEF
jgi:hypothetical protein